MPNPPTPDLYRLGRMCLDQPAPAVQDPRVLATGRGADDRFDQKPSLGLEVLGAPRDISHIEAAFLRTGGRGAAVEPADQLVLPPIRREWLGGDRDRAEHAGGYAVGDEQLDTGPEAAIREDEHDA